MNWGLATFTAAVAFLLSFYFTPMARQAALRFNLVDRPDGHLKQQKAPVPYLGGLAVFLAFLLSLGLVLEFDRQLLGLLLAATLAVLVGLVDDFGVLTPLAKVLGLGVAVFALLRAGVVVELAELPTLWHWPLAALWLLALANALNLLDIMDGLAAGVGAIAALALAAVAVATQQVGVGLAAAALGGALAGFLPWNWPSARIYLGDAGSLFLGLTLGALALMVRWSDKSPAGFLAPLAVLALPLSEVLFVTVARLRKGLPFWRGSPDHFPLRWRKLRQGHTPSTVGFCWLWGGLWAGVGVFLALWPGYPVSLGLFLALGLIWAGWLFRLSRVEVP